MESLEQELTEGIGKSELEICLGVIEKMTRSMEKAKKRSKDRSVKRDAYGWREPHLCAFSFCQFIFSLDSEGKMTSVNQKGEAIQC